VIFAFGLIKLNVYNGGKKIFKKKRVDVKRSCILVSKSWCLIFVKQKITLKGYISLNRKILSISTVRVTIIENSDQEEALVKVLR
jgi:hypothetical protein